MKGWLNERWSSYLQTAFWYLGTKPSDTFLKVASCGRVAKAEKYLPQKAELQVTNCLRLPYGISQAPSDTLLHHLQTPCSTLLHLDSELSPAYETLADFCNSVPYESLNP